MYVDASLLGEGIYVSSKPFIYDKEETISALVNQGRLMQDMIGKGFVPENYFDNLKQCQLVDFFITEYIP